MTASRFDLRPWAAALLLATLAACGGGGGGRDPVLGFDGVPPGGFPPGTVPVVAAAIPLGVASTFGAFGGGGGITNAGLTTVINNGDIGTTGASSKIVDFHDSSGCVYGETPLNKGDVKGLIYTDGPPVCGGTEGTLATMAIATQAQADTVAAYNQLAAMPAGPKPGAGNLAGLTLAPGVYTSATSFLLTGGDLTLDAQGDPNAVWVFQMGSSLTVGTAVPSSVLLAGGALPKNVFWQVGSGATINPSGGGTFVGTVISQAATTVGTSAPEPVVTIEGRLLSLTAVTLVSTVINVPLP
jgi:hypothetical protein